MTHVVFRGGLLDGRTMLLFEASLGEMFNYAEVDPFEGGKRAPGIATIYRRVPEPDRYGRTVYKA